MTIKPDLNQCKALLNEGFSLLTVGDNKQPNIKWSDLQKNAVSPDNFENFYNLQSTKAIGIITGYNDLEVIDVDLKVLPDLKERESFWNEYISLLTDNIEDFKTKFVICKTQNAGYHILYKCKTYVGNKSIAKLKGHQTCIIESRGKGGYVFMYQSFIQGTGYTDIKEISDTDREILWLCSKSFHYVEEKETPEIKYKAVENQYHEIDVKVWDDYNKKTRLWSLIQYEFVIVRKTHDKIYIRRNGTKNAISGTIFIDRDCMYLFTTGTQYPSEKLLSPFSIYTIQKHGGNYSLAAKELYSQGFGSRFKKIPKPEIKKEKIKVNTDNFPIEIFPEQIQNFIIQVHKTLNASIDYLGSSMMWVLSLCVGNSLKIEVKRGWVEAGVLWIAIVGKAGIGKTHNIQAIVNPLTKINEREIKRYNDNLIQYRNYIALDKKEKANTAEIKEPIKTQFIVGDITLEAFFDHHEANKNGIGILRDELSGWIKDLNKYRAGSDLETYLSCWSNQQIILTRKTAKSAYVSNAFVPIIGGVQPSILSLHYTSENKDNGFMDRWLLCYPELQVDKYNESEINQDLLNWYDEFIVSFFDIVRNQIIEYDDFGNICARKARWSEEAKKEWIRVFNKITDMQNSEEENEYMKSILPKQKSYVARFALLLNTLYACERDVSILEVTKEAVLNAEKLSDYYILMAKKNKVESIETKEIKDNIKFSQKHTSREQFEVIFAANPELNRSKVAEELGVSRSTIKNWITELAKTGQ